MEKINSSFPPSPNSSSLLTFDPVNMCSDSPYEVPITLSILIVTLLFLLPLFLRVLCLANARGRRRPVATATNSDLFAVHMIVMELIGLLPMGFYLIGYLMTVNWLMQICTLITSLSFAGQPLFHCCTCVERYLAVVHPIKYLGLKGGGARVWHVTAGCVWLLCFGWIGFHAWYLPYFPIGLYFSLCILCILIITFCCISVLHTLIRPGPGDGGGDRDRVDQSKRRAFWTITAILVAVTLNLFVSVIMSLLQLQGIVHGYAVCLGFGVNYMFSLPSSAVQPLLFLHRVGKLPGCRHNEG